MKATYHILLEYMNERMKPRDPMWQHNHLVCKDSLFDLVFLPTAQIQH